MSNLIRAGRAKSALAPYPKAEDLEEAATDLLADLMHLCTLEGLDFEHTLEMARVYWTAEKDGFE